MIETQSEQIVFENSTNRLIQGRVATNFQLVKNTISVFAEAQ